MKFSEMPYARPDLDELKQQLQALKSSAQKTLLPRFRAKVSLTLTLLSHLPI